MSAIRYVVVPDPVVMRGLANQDGAIVKAELFTALDYLSSQPAFREGDGQRKIVEVLTRFEDATPGTVVELPEGHWSLVTSVWKSISAAEFGGVLRHEARLPFLRLMLAFVEARDTADGLPIRVGKAAKAAARASANGKST